MQLHQLIEWLEHLAPLRYQESYDNSGLLVGEPDQDITGVLVSLDCTEAVVEEAIASGCNVIVAHHPIIFSGLKKLTGSNYIERTVMKALRNRVAIYAIHTNLDNIREGVNAKICEKIGLHTLDFLQPKAGEEHAGSGMLAELAEAMPEADFLSHLKESMELPLIRHTELRGKPVKKVAVCGGAGSFLLPKALEAEADFFITADYKYHQFFDAEGKIVIADIGHYESEVFTKDLLRKRIQRAFDGLPTRLAETVTNPVRYFW